MVLHFLWAFEVRQIGNSLSCLVFCHRSNFSFRGAGTGGSMPAKLVFDGGCPAKGDTQSSASTTQETLYCKHPRRGQRVSEHSSTYRQNRAQRFQSTHRRFSLLSSNPIRLLEPGTVGARQKSATITKCCAEADSAFNRAGYGQGMLGSERQKHKKGKSLVELSSKPTWRHTHIHCPCHLRYVYVWGAGGGAVLRVITMLFSGLDCHRRGLKSPFRGRRPSSPW